MYGSRFQKRHKQRNVHNDHYVTNDTAIIVDISFYTCAERSKPLVSVYILPSPYSQKTSRYRKRKAYPYICDNFDFPCFVPHAFKPACLPFPHRAMADKPIFRQWAAKGTPATASHACMTMAVTGLPSRRQESSAFPFYFCIALYLSPWRIAPYHLLLFPFHLSTCMPRFPCRLQDCISMSFSLLGQR